MQQIGTETYRDQAHTPVHIDIDRLGGGELTGHSGTSAVLTIEALQYLDITDCASLVYLDLTNCRTGCHITIRDCPSLRLIRVRAEGSGAVIHLDSGDQFPCLRVEGLVDEIDARWSSGQFSVNSSDYPWQGVWVSHHINNIPNMTAVTSAKCCECWILLAPEMSHVVIDTAGVRHLYISGGKRLQALSVISLSEQRAQIDLQALPELLSVDMHAPKGSCRIRDCRSLASVSGILTDLHLTHVAHRVDALHVEVPCERVVLSHSPVEALLLTEPAQLSLIHCAALNKVSLPPMTSVHCEGPVPMPLLGVASVTVDESSVSALISAYPSDPAGIMAKLTTLIPSMAASAPCVRALQLLQRLSELGAPPEQVWQLRLTLSAKHLTPRVKASSNESNQHAIALGHWKWQMPNDLGRESWMADYRLWVTCAIAVANAFHYRRAMIRACVKDPDGLAMQTVIHAMARHHDTTPYHEVDLWRDVMIAMAELEPMHGSAWPRYTRALSSRYGRDVPLDRAYLMACEALLPLDETLEVLQLLGVHRPEIRGCLLRIAHSPNPWREARCSSPRDADHCRAKAMALAISIAA